MHSDHAVKVFSGVLCILSFSTGTCFLIFILVVNMLLVAMLIMQLFVKSQINGSNIFYFLSLAVRQESG